MFLRMVTASLLRRRSRMLVALLSIAIGATILSGLVTIYYDVPRQMGAQFRGYGANMVLLPSDGGTLTMEAAESAMAVIEADQLVGAAPYRYARVDMVSRQQSFMAAGTDFGQARKTSPYFTVEGRYPESEREVLVGKAIADTIGVNLKGVMELTYQPTVILSDGEQAGGAAGSTQLSGGAEGWNGGRVYVTMRLDDEGLIESIEADTSSQTPEIGGACSQESFTSQFVGKSAPVTLGSDVDAVSGATVTSAAVVDAVNSARSASTAVESRTINYTVVGILDTGGDEEGYVFLSLDGLAALTGEAGILDVMELSVSATQDGLDRYISIIDEGGEVAARLVKRVTRSETAVLSKLQALVFLVTVVVLMLTMICVSTTMMAVISESRKEIGLRKALGASDGGIRSEFLGEALLLGLLGGVSGAMLGFAFAQLVSVNVFGSSITFQPLLLPAAVLVSMAVTGVSCLTPIKRAVAIDPALVLKGE
jgi:putative ABC transport system permease protein